MTIMAERNAHSTAPSVLDHYRAAVLKLLNVSEENADLLAGRLYDGTIAFSQVSLDLHPVGVSAATMAGLRKDLSRPHKAAEAQSRLDEAARLNAQRRRAFARWLGGVASSLPAGWLDHMLGALRPEVTYVRFMPEVHALLVETD